MRQVLAWAMGHDPQMAVRLAIEQPVSSRVWCLPCVGGGGILRPPVRRAWRRTPIVAKRRRGNGWVAEGVGEGGAKLAEGLDERDAGTDERCERAGDALGRDEDDHNRADRRQGERDGHGCLHGWDWGLLWPGAAIAPWMAIRTRLRFPVLRENYHFSALE
jgi:hypothetical protein